MNKTFISSQLDGAQPAVDSSMSIRDPVFFLSLAVVSSTLAILTIAGSLPLLLTIFKARHLRYLRHLRLLPEVPSFMLVANLCVSDMMVGLVAFILVIVKDIYCYQNLPVPEKMDAIIRCVLGLSFFASIGTIIALSYGRYIAAQNPFKYKCIVTKTRIKIVIAVIWTASLTLCFIPLANIPEKIYDIFYAYTYSLLPAVLLTVIYIKVFRALGERKRELREAGITSAMRGKKISRERKMVVAFVMVLVLFYLTVLPDFITVHLRYFYEDFAQSLIFKKLEIIFSRLRFLNFVANPFLYAWRRPKYRKAFQACFANVFKSSTSQYPAAPQMPQAGTFRSTAM